MPTPENVLEKAACNCVAIEPPLEIPLTVMLSLIIRYVPGAQGVLSITGTTTGFVTELVTPEGTVVGATVVVTVAVLLSSTIPPDVNLVIIFLIVAI